MAGLLRISESQVISKSSFALTLKTLEINRNVSKLGSTELDSYLETFAFERLILLANCCWVKPASIRSFFSISPKLIIITIFILMFQILKVNESFKK